MLDKMEGRIMKAVVFDLDGTLVDSAPDIHAAVNRMLSDENSEPLDLATVTSFIGNGLPKLVERVIRARRLDLARHEALSGIVLDYYNKDSSALSVLYPNLIDALDGLKSAGYLMGVCTNKPVEPAERILSDFGLSGYFDVVVGGDSLPKRKPDPAPLQECARQLGVDLPIYVGDSEVDAATAKACAYPFGLFTLGYRKSPVEELDHRFAFADFSDLVANVLNAS
jgi:phosphoglycolate phosphatase